jgi:Dolichyl-phosphate-mannose-protein mannosyltransferase
MSNAMVFKKFRIGMYEYIMLLLVVLASTLRIVLISLNWPVTNSDEAIMDLMALHINTLGEHPIFFYGQSYMGPIEAYIGALCFRLFGVSIFSVRLGLIPFFALFLIGTYLLARKLYNKRLALFTVALLCLGSSDIFSRQLKAIGGYPEITFLGAFIFFLCCKLALSSYPRYAKQSHDQDSYQRQQRFRWLLYGFLGLLIGLSIWIDQILLPYIAAAMLLLLLFCWRDFFSRFGLCFLLGAIVGALPLIYYNFTAPPGQNSLQVLLHVHSFGQQELMALPTPFLRQLSGTFLLSLPTMTGFNPLCDINQIPLFGSAASISSTCITTQGAWSFGYLLLWLAAFLMASISLWRLLGRLLWTRLKRKDSQLLSIIQQMETREQIIIYTARLMLLISAMLTLIQYLLSPSAGLTPNTSARYLEAMLISTPAILWPLWSAIRAYRERKTFSLHCLRFGSFCLMICIVGMFLVGTARILLDVPGAENVYDRDQTLVQTLLSSGITRFYSEYWTCNKLIFQSDERLICSNLNGGLQTDPIFNRYQPYYDSVREANATAYVFPQGSAQQQNMDRYIHATYGTSLPNTHYTRRIFKGFVIYQMKTPVNIP